MSLSTSHRQVEGRGGRTHTVATDSVAILTMSIVLAAELPGLADPTLGPIRAVGLTLLFATLHVVGFVVGRSPFRQPVGWVAVAFAGIAVLAGSAAGALEPIEVGTVPVAVALLVTGSLRLEATPLARSWPWLGPGSALLLLPSLVATTEDRPLWRLVALGVVAVAVVIIAARRRLQAPFLIGIAVALIHGVATVLPHLRIVYQALPWWLWLGVGGVLLIVLAASYERRIRDLKSVAMKVAALR
jgi:hypothetical protein